MKLLRKDFTSAPSVYLRVVKTIAGTLNAPIVGTDVECSCKTRLLYAFLIAFAKDDPGAAARIIKNFRQGA